MFESFLNPGYLIAGAALISLPIIIHLINRMRFKRVRWAAMEFLLKSQKRNRRRLIIEQLILLALRCLLVLLGVLLVGRFIGFTFAGLIGEPQNTIHFVILDDTPSMTDHHRQEGETKDCFRFGKELIVKEIARNAVQARTHQQLILIYQSDPGTVRFNQRLNDQSIQELEKVLDGAECSALRTDMAKAVEIAKATLDKTPQDRHVLHVISDFRQRDWSEPDVAGLSRALQDAVRANIKVNLIDAAHPYRSDLQKVPLYHDNLAIVELRPETRIAAKDLPVQFTVTVANFGISERKNLRVAVKVNGGERLEGSVNVTVPASLTWSETFQITLDELGPNLISANLENEDTGLQIDNTRYAVVDVRRQVPVLIVDGDLANGLKPGGDTFHLQTLLTVAKGYQAVPRGVTELDKPNLEQYACIYLLNVPELSENGLKNLERYVNDGGSVAFFMGPRVRPDYYNKMLYANGKGLFPAPLADRPFPPSSDKELEPDLFDLQFKMFVRDEQHPIFKEVWQPNIRSAFKFLPIKRYYPVPRQKWEKEPGKVVEVATLPNQRPLRDYASNTQALLESLDQPINDPKYAKYAPGLEQHKADIQNRLLRGEHLYELANALEGLLNDTGQADDPNTHPDLAEFWKQPENSVLRGRIDKFRETVQLGDPFVITNVYGKGRVVAFMTTAGRAWNDWAGGSPVGSMTYPAVMLELQKYLTSAGGENNLTVGTPLEIQLDSTRYDSKMRWRFQPELRDNKPAPPSEQLGRTEPGRVTFVFEEARKPGLYVFEFDRRSDEGNPAAAKPEPERRAYVFNVDPSESDLRRAAKEDMERAAPGVKVQNPESRWGAELKDRRNDLSEWPWFYLIFIVILVIEQALAVHLSFHLKGGEAVAPGTVRPQATTA